MLAARVVGIRQEGLNPCRMVPSMRDEVHVQLHDVTGKVVALGEKGEGWGSSLPIGGCAV